MTLIVQAPPASVEEAEAHHAGCTFADFVEVFAGVSNVLDTAPPALGFGPAATRTPTGEQTVLGG